MIRTKGMRILAMRALHAYRVFVCVFSFILCINVIDAPRKLCLFLALKIMRVDVMIDN